MLICLLLSILRNAASINVSTAVPQPSLFVSSSHPPPYYAGSSITLSCEATANPHIDTSITADFVWTKDNLTVSPSSVVTVTNDRVGRVYQSVLTISQLNQEQDSGLYQCSVQFRPAGLSQYLTASETTSSSVVELDIRGG